MLHSITLISLNQDLQDLDLDKHNQLRIEILKLKTSELLNSKTV